MAEREAFEQAGIETRMVEFTYPLCSGKPIGNHEYGGRIGGLGSGCTGCGIAHS